MSASTSALPDFGAVSTSITRSGYFSAPQRVARRADGQRDRVADEGAEAHRQRDSHHARAREDKRRAGANRLFSIPKSSLSSASTRCIEGEAFIIFML